jgi:ATP-dependent Clp protease ATP-binding subunit ClpC
MLEGVFPLNQFEKRDHENGIVESKNLSNLGLEFLKVDIPQLTKIRRKLMQRLGQPDVKRNFERLPRSQATHTLFNQAIQKIRSEKKECATFIDLLMQIDRNSVETSLPEIKKPPATNFLDVILSTSKTVNPSHSNFITRFGRDLTALAAQGKLNPMVGREKETNAITRILLRTTKRNVILIGEAGVGKTAVVEGLAQRLISLGAPLELQKTHIIQINIADLIANTIYRGEMEARVQELINEVSQNPNLVLFLDEIHLALRTGGGGQGTLDIANILKPALARDDFRCIGATTNEEYDHYVKDDSAFNRRFQVININEPSPEETFKICKSWAKRIGDHQKVHFDDEAIHEAISLCEKYIINRKFPDKAIDLMENSAVTIKINALHYSPDLSGLIKVTPDIIRETVRDHYGIDTPSKETTHFESARNFLEKSIIGQEQAIQQIDEALNLLFYRRFKDSNGCLGTLFFVGPDGAGKAHAARCIAKALFPSDTNAFSSLYGGL